MQEHHTRPHFIGKVRYKKSTREKEENIKRVQEKRRKTPKENKRKGEKHQESTRDEEKNIKRVQTMENITADEERTKQIHNFL